MKTLHNNPLLSQRIEQAHLHNLYLSTMRPAKPAPITVGPKAVVLPDARARIDADNLLTVELVQGIATECGMSDEWVRHHAGQLAHDSGYSLLRILQAVQSGELSL